MILTEENQRRCEEKPKVKKVKPNTQPHTNSEMLPCRNPFLNFRRIPGTLYTIRFNIYLLTAWCRFLLEQLTGLQLFKKFPRHFTEPEGSLPHSQASATCLYPGPAQSSPYTHIPPPADPS